MKYKRYPDKISADPHHRKITNAPRYITFKYSLPLPYCHKTNNILAQLIFILLATTVFIIPIARESIAGPGWQMVTLCPVSPEDAREALEKEITMTRMRALGGPATSETENTPEIKELARALQKDPKRIYAYVRNHIDYVPTFGSVNGATATLLAGRGNDFDQASLFIALMRASGFTANYITGDVVYTFADAAKWLGVNEDPNVICYVIAKGGIPIKNLYINGSIEITRVWAKAAIDGADYVFDPAFKYYDKINGLNNLSEAMAYDQNSFLAAASAGATIQGSYVKNINEENIKSKLNNYSTSLATYIRNFHPNAFIEEIIGGHKIHYEEIAEYTTVLPHQAGVRNERLWQEIPDNYRAKLCIKHNGIDHTFNSFEIAGKRVSLFYNAANAPVLYVDGNCTAVGNPTDLNVQCELNISVDHPYVDANSKTTTMCDQQATFTVKSGSTYNIFCDFESVSKDLISFRNSLLSENRDLKVPEESDAVLGEGLYIMGLTWMHELRLSELLLGNLSQTTYVRHHAVGIVAQENISSTEKGYYIDVKMNVISVTSLNRYNKDEESWFYSLSLIGSALEHGMLEQLQGKDKPGASTVKLLQINNSNAKKTFYANKSNFATIKTQLLNYDSNSIDQLGQDVLLGYTFILPETAYIPINNWHGIGYIQLLNDANACSVDMIISGGYLGGYSSIMNPVSIPMLHIETTISVPDFSIQAHIQTPLSIEPVDMASGAYLYSHTDLSLGRQEPLGLHFTRSYNSSENFSRKGLGNGWTHNYEISVKEHSHGDPGLGSRLPVDAASAIAGFYVSIDLFRSSSGLKNWVISSLVNKWVMDQLIGNAASVYFGHKSLEFIKLADATYSSPPGITAELLYDITMNTYTLQERFDTFFEFNAENHIKLWQDADGNLFSFLYNGNKLQSIQDAFGRKITLHYTGDLIDSVSDSSGRSISYSYDSKNNMIGYYDTELKLWGYGYNPDKAHNTDHLMTSLTNPLGVTTALNTYDSLGRVDTQTVPRQGDLYTTYNFYFSGFRNIEEDPNGNQTIYYFDQWGRTTCQENALGHKEMTGYDSQGHVVLSIDPRKNVTVYEYDGDNNLRYIINAFDKQTELIYDDRFRQTDIFDPLGHRKHFNYDAEHHLTGITSYPEDGTEIHTASTYYQNGLICTASDGRGATTSYTYDTYGNPSTSRLNSTPPVIYAYDPIGRMTSLTDQAAATTSFVYDTRGLVQTKTDPLNRITKNTYYLTFKLIN